MSRDIPATNEIEMFLHCGKCIKEYKEGKAKGHSPQTYSQLSVGWTPLGLQVWCDRHECNVIHIDFQGQQHPANLKAKDTDHEDN